MDLPTTSERGTGNRNRPLAAGRHRRAITCVDAWRPRGGDVMPDGRWGSSHVRPWAGCAPPLGLAITILGSTNGFCVSSSEALVGWPRAWGAASKREATTGRLVRRRGPGSEGRSRGPATSSWSTLVRRRVGRSASTILILTVAPHPVAGAGGGFGCVVRSHGMATTRPRRAPIRPVT